MSDTDFPSELFDDLDQEISIDNLGPNQRIAVRYRRQDINAVIKFRSLLFQSLCPVILHDISSKGAAIFSPKKLRKKSRVSLYLRFEDGKRFEIDAVVVYISSEQKYGLKFHSYHEELAEHLLSTQTELTFS